MFIFDIVRLEISLGTTTMCPGVLSQLIDRLNCGCIASRPSVPVLRGLDITAEPGSYVAIVGPSGSGYVQGFSVMHRD